MQPAKPQTRIEEFAAVYEVLDNAFGAQAHDGAWAMNAQRISETVLTAMLPARSTLRSVDCRATMCRIESLHENYANANAFVNKLTYPQARPWNGAFYTGPISEEASGAVTFVTYLSREGSAMPAIPDPSADNVH